jgi:uncharacterized protein YggE
VRKLDKLGCRASHTAEIRFDACRVPLDNVLGGVDRLERRLREAHERRDGSSVLGAFEQTRPMVAAQALGVARAAHEFAVEWATRREAFGGPVIENQGVSFPLADSLTELLAARLLTYHAAHELDANPSPSVAHGKVAIAKLYASEAANRIVGAVRDQGIARHDIRTEQVSIYPQTSNDGISIVGYSASSTVSVTVRDIDRAGKIVDAAVAAGGNQVYGPSLSVSDTHEAYRSAVKAALADARSRAEALAAEAGVTLGAPVAVVESGGGYPVPYAAPTLAADAAAEVSIEPGVDRITANLTVTFAIGS